MNKSRHCYHATTFRGLHLKQRIRSGFTLVELLIVIIVVSILAAIAVPKFSSTWRRSTESRLRSNLKEYRSAIERFHGDTGLYPASLSDARKTTAPTTGLNSTGATVAIPPGSWQGPYIKVSTSQSSNVFPDLRSLGYSYGTTSPTVGKVVMNSGHRDLNGVRYNEW